MELHLEGKNAIVTGGASGIGLACCRELAKEGVNLLIADIKEAAAQQAAKAMEAYGVKAYVAKTDVCSSRSVKEMVKKGNEVFGQIDILVNSAGIVKISELISLTETEWDIVME